MTEATWTRDTESLKAVRNLIQSAEICSRGCSKLSVTRDFIVAMTTSVKSSHQPLKSADFL